MLVWMKCEKNKVNLVNLVILIHLQKLYLKKIIELVPFLLKNHVSNHLWLFG